MNKESHDSSSVENSSRTDVSHSPEDLGSLRAPAPSLVSEFGVESVWSADPKIFYEQIFATFQDSQMPRLTPRFAELAQLHAVVDTTSTVFGKLALMRHLLHPPTTMERAVEMQEAVKEIMRSSELREKLQRFVDTFTAQSRPGEPSSQDNILLALGVRLPRAEPPTIKQLLWGLGRVGSNSARKHVRQFSRLGDACRRSESITGFESSYLHELLELFTEARRHPAFEMFNGKMHVTWRGVHAPSEVHPLLPVWRYTDKFFDPEQSILASAVLASYRQILNQIAQQEDTMSILAGVSCIGSLVLVTGRSGMAGMISKWGSARLLQSEPILKIIDAIGELDALLAIAHFNERFADSSVWPEFIVGDRYRLEAKGLKAPCIQAAGSCVANDVILQGGRPLIITGPNSAGKSTLLSAITHNHILAQIGAKVIAEHFCSTIIDQVLYQGPESAALNAEGRFGMEMLETKRLFERASRKSLFVLDEVAGGTSTEESREIAQWIVHEGLVELGCGVLMVTHDHELARRLGTLGKVEPIKMDLEDEAPTYQAAPGVATSSRPDRVLNAIGFTREHMLEIVRRKQQAGSDIP